MCVCRKIKYVLWKYTSLSLYSGGSPKFVSGLAMWGAWPDSPGEGNGPDVFKSGDCRELTVELGVISCGVVSRCGLFITCVGFG